MSAAVLDLTAQDVMSRDVKTIDVGTPIRTAAVGLAGYDVRGVPVVDSSGRCVGAFSVSDVARWVGGRVADRVPGPRTCAFQHADREPGGREAVLCLLAEGVCPFQRVRESDGKAVCSEPHCVPTDWQMVDVEPGPTTVGDVMTTRVVSAGPDASVSDLARIMLDRGVHRLFVLDREERPVGVVAVDDLLQVLAHPELDRPGIPPAEISPA